MSANPQPPKPLVCPLCYKELVRAGSFIICPYCRQIITFKPIKDLEAIHFTGKEIEQMEEKRKAQNKENHIEEARKQHLEDLKKEQNK